jgi:hypothetical protein
MPRSAYTSVTISILVPAQAGNSEGKAFVPVEEEDEDGWPGISLVEKSVRRFTHDDLREGRWGETWRRVNSEERTWKRIPNYDRIACVVAFVRAAHKGDAFAMQNKYEEHLKQRETHSPFARKILQGFANESVRHHIAHAADSVRFVIWESKQGQAPGLFCPDISAALLVHGLTVAFGNNLGLLLCPKWGNPFPQRFANQSYCSRRCSEAHRVQRFRAKQREKDSAKRGGRNRNQVK